MLARPQTTRITITATKRANSLPSGRYSAKASSGPNSQTRTASSTAPTSDRNQRLFRTARIFVSIVARSALRRSVGQSRLRRFHQDDLGPAVPFATLGSVVAGDGFVRRPAFRGEPPRVRHLRGDHVPKRPGERERGA